MSKIVSYPNNIQEEASDIGYTHIMIFNRESARKLTVNSVSKDKTFEVAQNKVSTTGFSTGRTSGADLGKTGADAKLGFVEQKGVVRIEDSIVLPMPNEIQSPLAVTYEVMTQSVIGALMNAGGAMVNGDVSAGEASSALVRKVLKDTAGAVSPNLANNVGAITGMVTNERKEQFFQGVEFRRFSLSYILTPKNESEISTIREIVKMFRFYMLPDLDPTGFFYIAPSEFQIRFMYKGSDNPAIPKIDKCFLQNCSLNFTPKSKWIATEQGQPVEMMLTLDFVEKSSMVRGKVETNVSGSDSSDDVSSLASGF